MLQCRSERTSIKRDMAHKEEDRGQRKRERAEERKKIVRGTHSVPMSSDDRSDFHLSTAWPGMANDILRNHGKLNKLFFPFIVTWNIAICGHSKCITNSPIHTCISCFLRNNTLVRRPWLVYRSSYGEPSSIKLVPTVGRAIATTLGPASYPSLASPTVL